MKVQKYCVNAFLMLVIATFLSGCTTPGTEIDRKRDFQDIWTLSTGRGFGLKVRIGPAQAGVMYPPRSNEAGLRGGVFYSPYKHDYDEYLLFYGQDRFVGTDISKERGKSFYAQSMGCLAYPLPWKSKLYDEEDKSKEQTNHPWSYYTQTEIVFGFFGKWRVGMNWGELLDFGLGWCNLDLYGDDLKIKELMDKAHAHKEEEVEEEPIIIDLSTMKKRDE